jgi:N-acyl-D-amino-acid deacylase
VLQKETIEEMFARPPGLAGHTEDERPTSVYYSLGWMNRSLGDDGRLNNWHTGSLPGTAAILIRRHDGRNFVALFNKRESPKARRLSSAIDPLLHRAANAVVKWPDGDRFGDFE